MINHYKFNHRLVFILTLGILIGANSRIAAQTITTGNVSGTYCVNSGISLTYTISGTFNTGNVFRAQLSDASGSFASPVVIGTNATTNSGTINATLPAGTPSGSGYKIRVVSSNPPVTGSAIASSITVVAFSGNAFQNNYTMSIANTYNNGSKAAIQLSDGNFAVLGFGMTLSKIDTSGNIIWARQICEQSNGTNMYGDDFRQTSDGGFIIGGHGHNDLYLVKTDDQGIAEWSQYYGDNTPDSWGDPGTVLTSIRQTSDGGYIVSGITPDFGFGWDGVGGKPLIMKTDGSGNVTWTKIFVGFDVNNAWQRSGVDVAEVPGGGGDLMIWGITYPWNCCGNPPYNTYTSLGYLVRTHADGTVVWSKQITNISNGQSAIINGASENMVATSGGFYLGVGHGIDYAYTSSVSVGGIIKVDFNGNVIWAESINTPEYLESIAATADSGVVLSYGFHDYLGGIVKLSSSGAVQWGESYNAVNLRYAMCVVQTKDGGYLISGTHGAYGNGADLCLVKTDKNGLAGGNESSTSYAVHNAGCTSVVDSFGFLSYTMNIYNACTVTSNFNPVVTQFAGVSGSCTLKEIAFNSNSCDTNANFSADHVEVCAGNAVNFTGVYHGSALAWNWTFEGGTPGSSNSQYPKVTYDTAGNYDVKLVVTTASSPSTATKSKYITVDPKPVAGVLFTLDSNICTGAIASLSDTGYTNNMIQWQTSFTSGGFTDIYGADSANYDTLINHTAYFRVVNWNGSCADTSAAIRVTVNPALTPPTLSTNDSTICSSDSTRINSSGTYSSYSWNNEDTRPYTYAKAAGGYRVTVTDSNHCSAVSGQVNISVYPVPSVSIVVQGDTLASFNAVSYQWYRNSNPIPGDTSSIIIARQTGDYSVQITDSNGCVAISNSVHISFDGINDAKINSGISIYPNPASGEVFLVLNNRADINEIQIVNMMGQEIKRDFLRSSGIDRIRIDLSFLPSGVFNLMFYNGKQYAGCRLLVHEVNTIQH